MKLQELQTKFETYLLTERRVAQNTVAAYKRDINQLIGFLDQKKILLSSLTSDDLKQFLHYLHDLKLDARSISRKISAIKLLFSYAHERFAIPNVAQELIFPKIEKKLPHYLTEEEIQQLFTVIDADTSPHGIRNKVMIYMLYATGMRATELVKLAVSAIHFDTGYISVQGKGGKQRLIPLPQPMLTLLQDYLSHAHKEVANYKNTDVACPYVFPTRYGSTVKAMTRQALWGIIKDAWKKTGNARAISPHILRHSIATHLLKKGAHLRSLQMLLGHENISTVQVYTHVETSHLRTIYDKKHPRS